MYTGLNLPNLGFAFLDKGFLVSELGRRQLGLEDLSLPLFDGPVVLRPVPRGVNLNENRSG